MTKPPKVKVGEEFDRLPNHKHPPSKPIGSSRRPLEVESISESWAEKKLPDWHFTRGHEIYLGGIAPTVRWWKKSRRGVWRKAYRLPRTVEETDEKSKNVKKRSVLHFAHPTSRQR